MRPTREFQWSLTKQTEVDYKLDQTQAAATGCDLYAEFKLFRNKPAWGTT